MAVIIFLILRREVPQIDSWYQRMVNKEQWHAAENCRHAAIGAAKNSDFARIVSNGTVHTTEKGYFTEDVVVGEMGESGAEVYFEFSCYHKPDGSIVKTHKKAKP
jgi:hypothetical protein